MYTIQWTKDAVQHLTKLPQGIQESIVKELSALQAENKDTPASGPFSLHCAYTLELGQYQIYLWIMEDSLLVFDLVEKPELPNLPEHHHIITHDGSPVAVVVPYADYLTLTGSTLSQREEIPLSLALLEEAGAKTKVFPHPVVTARLQGKTFIKAWREHLALSSEEVAKRMKISEESYERLEATHQQIQINMLCNVAKALGIRAGQLFLYQ